MKENDIVLVLFSGNELKGVIKPDNEIGLANFIESLIPEGITRIEIREIDVFRL